MHKVIVCRKVQSKHHQNITMSCGIIICKKFYFKTNIRPSIIFRIEDNFTCMQVNCISNWEHNKSRRVTKPTKWHVRPAKTQISLGIRSVWPESSLSTWRKRGSLATHWAHSEALWSDWADAQADLSLRWAHSHIVGFVSSRLIML